MKCMNAVCGMSVYLMKRNNELIAIFRINY